MQHVCIGLRTRMHEVTYLGTPTHPRTPAARFSSTHFPLRRRHNHFAPRLGRVLSKRRHFMLDDAFIFTITAFPWPNHCEFNSRDADVAGGWRKPSNRKSTPSALPLAHVSRRYWSLRICGGGRFSRCRASNARRRAKIADLPP